MKENEFSSLAAKLKICLVIADMLYLFCQSSEVDQSEHLN